jgi:hypothetical protein
VLTKVRYELLTQLLGRRSTLVNFAVSFALNWLLGPALMTGLAWAGLPDLPRFRNGVIMVGLARCIAMVLIWNQVRGWRCWAGLGLGWDGRAVLQPFSRAHGASRSRRRRAAALPWGMRGVGIFSGFLGHAGPPQGHGTAATRDMIHRWHPLPVTPSGDIATHMFARIKL